MQHFDGNVIAPTQSKVMSSLGICSMFLEEEVLYIYVYMGKYRDAPEMMAARYMSSKASSA